MAASTRAAIMKGKGKFGLKPNKGNKMNTMTSKRKPLYKTKFRGTKLKKAPQYDSSSDDEDNIQSLQTKDASKNKEMEMENEEAPDAEVKSDEAPEVDSDEAPEVDSDSENETIGQGNEGWADVMTKILNSGRDKKSVILSRAQTDREIAFKQSLPQEDFEVDETDKAASETADGESAEVKKAKPQPVSYKEMKKDFMARREEKKCWESMGRVKPDITARQKERALQRIATRGIVHLFNAVKLRQSTIETKMKEVHGSEVKREKILKSMTKGDFLDVLKSKAKSISLEDVASSTISKSRSNKSRTEVKPGWNVFCEDFMIGAKMKDWDKESDSEDGKDTKKTGQTQDVDMSSSDED